jgi:hypothetical protein
MVRPYSKENHSQSLGSIEAERGRRRSVKYGSTKAELSVFSNYKMLMPGELKPGVDGTYGTPLGPVTLDHENR